MPWNYPLLLLAWKLAPALAAGNATVCKPSEVTPLSTLMLCVEHLPAGVVNLVAGAGEVGAALADPRVDGVAFTGSVETGKKVGHACMDRVARLNLEMGGRTLHHLRRHGRSARRRRPRRRLGRLPQRRPGLHFL